MATVMVENCILTFDGIGWLKGEEISNTGFEKAVCNFDDEDDGADG